MLTGIPLSQFTLNIAGITIQFVADDTVELLVSDIHRPFIVAANGGVPDCRLRVHYGALPRLKLEEKLFDSGAVWAIYRSGHRYELTFSSDSVGPEPYQVAIIDSTFKSGDLYVRPMAESPAAGQDSLQRVYPASYPLDEVIMVNLLARGRGVELHSCGVSSKGRGFIFAGTSGTGKSTMSRLWKDEKEALVLSDERIIVRKTDGHFRMYGTPWQSNAAAASPKSVPLERIFFIKHNPVNCAPPLKAGEAASRLFVRCFPTFWDEACLNYTLGFIGQLAEHVPCRELGFVPDRGVLDYVKEITSGGRVES